MVDFTDFGPVEATAPAGKVDFSSFKAPPEPAPTRESLGKENRKQLLEDLFGKPEGYTVPNMVNQTAAETAAVGDLVLSIPAQLMGVGADLVMRARAIGGGNAREKPGVTLTPEAAARVKAGETGGQYVAPVDEASRSAAAARNKIMETFGNPLQRLLMLAGMGSDEVGNTGTTGLMAKASSLIEKGGEWVEKNSNGLLTKGDVESIANTAMGAAGGKGLAAGLDKITPKEYRLEGVRMSPQALKNLQEERLRAGDPQDAAKAAQATADNAENGVFYYSQKTGNMAKSPDEAAAGAPAKTRMTQAKVLDFNDFGQLGEEPTPEGKGLPQATTLDRAMEKVTSGRQFDLTAEEAIAYRAWKKEPPPRAIVDERGFPLTPGQAAAAAGVAVVASQMDPDTLHDAVMATAGGFLLKHEGRGLSWEEFKNLDPALALSSVLARSDYTLKTLDRLPQNKTEFTKAHVEQELRRQDVTESEKNAVFAAMQEVPGDKMSAKDLVAGVKKATGDFELRPRETDVYGDYGLGNIREPRVDDFADDTGASYVTLPNRTTLYESPMELSRDNHFDAPNLFGWTRSFDEGGVRHVVEIQSDLAQHMKTLSPEVLAETQATIAKLEANNDALAKIYDGPAAKWLEKIEALPDGHRVPLQETVRFAMKAIGTPWEKIKETLRAGGDDYTERTLGHALMLEMKSLSRYISEDRAKIGNAGVAATIAPLIKNWPKRLVREELARMETVKGQMKSELATTEQRLGEAKAAAEKRRMDLGPGNWEKLQNTSYARTFDPLGERTVAHLEKKIAKLQDNIANPRIRFATADTVAKVEGWPDYRGRALDEARQALSAHEAAIRNPAPHQNPEDLQRFLPTLRARYDAAMDGKSPIFSPEHQSIYDRYKRDIEKFLKSLGGALFTDSQGHTWLEVPVPKKGPTQMFGGASPEMMARLAAVGLGAWAAYKFSDQKDLFNAFLGGAAGLALSHVTPAKAVATLKKWLDPDPRIRINHLGDVHEKVTRLGAIDTWGIQQQVEDLVPKTADRAKVTAALQSNNVASLGPKEQRAANIISSYYNKLSAGVPQPILQGATDLYLAAIWKWARNDVDRVGQWLDQQKAAGTTPTIADGKAQGFTPLSEDMSAILGVYGNAITRTIANKWFVEALRNEVDPAGRALAQPYDKAPASFEPITHPLFTGLKVHPDIAPSVKMLFDTSNPGQAMKIMQGLSDTSKRIAVSFSLFHAKALVDAMIGGSRNPAKALARLPGIVAGSDAFLQEMKKGSASPLISRAVGSGLIFSLERAGAGVEDAGTGFYSSMKALQGFLDKSIPGAGLPLKGLEELNHKVDTFMWARLHAGMKLHMFSEKYQEMLDNSAKKGTPLTPEQAGKIAASYTNDIFGGLNWRRIAEDAKSRWGRQVAQAVLNPAARRVLQILMFAPDWTLSTTRAAVKAFGGRPDFMSPTTEAGLHQQYLLRSAVYYMVVGDAINYSMSGHHLWENKDPTMIDLDPKGNRHMQWSKHTMEPIHWLTRPGQQGLNKLGFIPKEIATQALGTEWLSSSGRSPPMQSRIRHLAKNFTPIAVSQGSEGGLDTSIAGALGIPIYGKTEEQRAALKLQRAKLRREMSHGTR